MNPIIVEKHIRHFRPNVGHPYSFVLCYGAEDGNEAVYCSQLALFGTVRLGED